MKTIINYLDDLKDKYGSDNKTANTLNIARETISKIRSRGQMSDETAIKIADALGIERDEVLIAAAIARSTGEVRTAWEKIGRMSGIAVSLVMVATVSYGLVSMGYDTDLTTGLTADNIHYAKLCILGLLLLLCFFSTRLLDITSKEKN